MNIQYDEPVQLIRLKKNPYSYGEYYFNTVWNADTFPVAAKYDDYGYFKDIEVKPVNRIFPEIFGDDGEQPDEPGSVYMAVHKSIYDKFSQTLFTDSYDKEVWDGDKRVPFDESYWQRRVARAAEIFHEQDKFFDELSNSNEKYAEVRKNYHRIELFGSMDEFKGMPFWPSGEANKTDPTYFSEPTLPHEMLLFSTFIKNMDILNKKFKKSIYASQEDNYSIYGEMTKSMNAVLKEKRQRRRDYDD